MQVTFHQILPGGYIQEVYKSTGWPCGSNRINEMFEKLLASLMGSEMWEEFKSSNATSYLHLMNSFEVRKREVTDEHKKTYNIALPFGFIKFFTSKNTSVIGILQNCLTIVTHLLNRLKKNLKASIVQKD